MAARAETQNLEASRVIGFLFLDGNSLASLKVIPRTPHTVSWLHAAHAEDQKKQAIELSKLFVSGASFALSMVYFMSCSK
jgi:hypothetical protein